MLSTHFVPEMRYEIYKKFKCMPTLNTTRKDCSEFVGWFGEYSVGVSDPQLRITALACPAGREQQTVVLSLPEAASLDFHILPYLTAVNTRSTHKWLQAAKLCHGYVGNIFTDNKWNGMYVVIINNRIIQIVYEAQLCAFII
ncbi:Protein of unknown function [Gryllus bimaculatus]|nr:Protein of unknown function [Gryllus bimaculatus]